MGTEGDTWNPASLQRNLEEARKQSAIWTAVRVAAPVSLGLIAMAYRDPQFFAASYWTILISYEVMYALARKELFARTAGPSYAAHGNGAKAGQ